VWGQLAYATFDDELARTDGVRARALEYLLFALAAVVVAVSAVVVGIVLMAAYLVIPAAAARLWSRSLAGTSLRAVAIGVADDGGGRGRLVLPRRADGQRHHPQPGAGVRRRGRAMQRAGRPRAGPWVDCVGRRSRLR
jgi:hypothetical protein